MSGGGGDGGNGGGVGETDMGGYTDAQAQAMSDAIDAATAASAASMGLGGYSADQEAAVTNAAMAMDFGMDPMGVVGNVNDPNDAQSLGLSTAQGQSMATATPDLGPIGRGFVGLFGLSPGTITVSPDMTATQSIGFGVPGIGSAISNALGFDTSLGNFDLDISYTNPDDPGPSFDDSVGGDDLYTPVVVQPVTQPVAVVENVAAPIVVEDPMATPSLLMRPSTLNVAPANAPVAYSLLYPEQERRFQESFALRPEFYSGPLDTTGYQPVASLLI